MLAQIIASCLGCLVTGNQPKPVVVCVMSVALMVTKKAERHICIKVLPETCLYQYLR